MQEKLVPVEVTLNCDPKELLKAVFAHCVDETKEKNVYSPEHLTTYLMYELGNLFCPNAEKLIYELFCKEFDWKD